MAGKIVWTDLTVQNAESVKEFYRHVVGWTPEPVGMGDYEDYNMLAEGEKDPTAGVCHAMGQNADIPPVWMIYIMVEDLERSLVACEKLGGTILKQPDRDRRYAVIEDPAGAICTLYQEKDAKK